MIECIFTIDYEIYGNGQGSLNELIYQPAQKLMEICRERSLRFVTFVEVAELEIIENKDTDPVIHKIKNQIQDFYKKGFEIGLHLHPQWYNAQHENGRWKLDYREYNLCALTKERIEHIVDRSINYLRRVLEDPGFTPFSFRAGNWLFQPTKILANVLEAKGIKVDSSVFKGGLQRKYNLDYRGSLRNGYFWRFQDDVNKPDYNGALVEIPIYTKMVPPWQMITKKRMGLQKKGIPKTLDNNGFHRMIDFLRFQYPLKLDFCRMSITELTHMMDKIIQEDEQEPASFKPIVLIGHTKDLVDFETIKSFLSYLENKRIPVSTFKDVYSKCT